jgi:hypothetical protein
MRIQDRKFFRPQAFEGATRFGLTLQRLERRLEPLR